MLGDMQLDVALRFTDLNRASFLSLPRTTPNMVSHVSKTSTNCREYDLERHNNTQMRRS